MGTFCFVCGLIGHAERDCSIVYAHPEKFVEKAYGNWLRAPHRNVKNNTGARWLRSTGAEDGTWGKNKTAEIATVHDGLQGEEKFMEVDGVVRQTTDDTEGIRILSRDSMEVGLCGEINACKEQKIGDETEINKESQTENIVIDTKRKRLDVSVLGDNHGLDTENYLDKQSVVGSKNLLMAGPGLQARQGL